MNDQDYSAEEAGSGGILGAAGKAASTWIGAAVSLALMAGMAVWFYRLGTRDASQIPVILAAEGPARERPEDPGGDEAPHQGIRSYAAVEDGAVPGTAPEPRPELAPEPPAPAASDGPMRTDPPRARPAELVAVPETVVAAIDSVRLRSAAPAAVIPPAPQVAPEPPTSPETLPQAVLDPVPEVEPEAAPEPEPEAEPEPEVVASTGPAPEVSPRARPRPPGLVARATEAAATAVAVREDGAEALAAEAARSAVQVQLGAYETPEITRVIWDQIIRTHQDVLSGRALAVQSTVSGGKTWYRLRVGPFRDSSEARNVCAALQARGQDCIVARNG